MRNEGKKIDFEETFQNETLKDHGYFIEADLIISNNQKDFFENFPPAPARTKIRKEDMSEISRHILEEGKVITDNY